MSLIALAESLGTGNRVSTDWMEQAECRQRVELHGGKEYTRVVEYQDGKKFEELVDVDEWSAPRGDEDKHVRKLRTICARCPVRNPCLAWAFQAPESIQFGLYAGTTGSQRMRYRNRADPIGRLSRWDELWGLLTKLNAEMTRPVVTTALQHLVESDTPAERPPALLVATCKQIREEQAETA